MAARLAALLACDAQLTEIIRLIGSVASEDIADMPTSRKRAGWTTANADTLRVLSHRPPVWAPLLIAWPIDAHRWAHLHRDCGTGRICATSAPGLAHSCHS